MSKTVETPSMKAADANPWDHTGDDAFYDYYAQASQSGQTLQRFSSVRDTLLRLLAQQGRPGKPLGVADIGCGAGTQAMLWASMGHKVHGLDINSHLIQLAIQRADQAGLDIDFAVGSADELPWRDNSMDVCLVPELLEHVENWQGCVREFARVLQPGGIMFLSTNNKLCPVQMEFDLPLYSWYPARLKKHYEHLAKTTRPELANHAKYPAVNWFSFYSLRSALHPLGFRSMDRFDVIDLSKRAAITRLAVAVIRTIPFLRWLSHVTASSTMMYAIKEGNCLAKSNG